MISELLSNTNDDILIFVERMGRIKEIQLLISTVCTRNNNINKKIHQKTSGYEIKNFIEETVQKYTINKSKRDNFYEHELIKFYKTEIQFLKEKLEKKRMPILIICSRKS